MIRFRGLRPKSTEFPNGQGFRRHYLGVRPFPSSPSVSPSLDRAGVVVSFLCAVHCLVTPLVLAAAPLLGGIWVHPHVHLGLAAFAVPIAAFALGGGYRSHRKRRVLGAGAIGAALVLAGAAVPMLLGTGDACCEAEAPPGARLASILSFLGGAGLISAHIMNVRCRCACCDRPSSS